MGYIPPPMPIVPDEEGLTEPERVKRRTELFQDYRDVALEARNRQGKGSVVLIIFGLLIGFIIGLMAGNP